MQAILRRMNLIDEFEIVMFGDEVRFDSRPRAHFRTTTARTATSFKTYKRNSTTLPMYFFAHLPVSQVHRHAGDTEPAS